MRPGFQAPLNAQATLRAEPPFSPLIRRFGTGYENRNGFAMRYFTDRNQSIYFGYEVLIEEQTGGGHLLTFGKLGLSPLALLSRQIPRMPVPNQPSPRTSGPWTMQDIPEIPKPRVIRPDGVVSILLFEDRATGEKLFDDLRIPARPPVLGPVPAPAPTPTVTGNPRDFTAADAELRIWIPLVTLNGEPTSIRIPHNTNAAIVWISIPGRGRFFLSLIPRPDLGFEKVGEVRGGTAKFTVGKDSIVIDSPNEIAPAVAAYHLYVLADPKWEPVSDNQKGNVLMGSITVAELRRLR